MLYFRTTKRLICTLLFLCPFFAIGQETTKGTVVLSLNKLTNDSTSAYLLNKWRFIEADSPAMALPEYDDNKWQEIDPEIRIGKHPDAKSNSFNSIGWFRYSFIADSSITNIPLALSMTQYGASEVYLDGKKIDTFGIINGRHNTVYYDPQGIPAVFIIQTPGSHVLAVRYANFEAQNNHNRYGRDFAGFKMEIGQAKYLIIRSYNATRVFTFIYILFFGIFISLAFLHLFLFLYHRSFKPNLFFCIFCLSLAGGFLIAFLNRLSGDPRIAINSVFFSLLAGMSAAYSLSGFLNELFNKGKLRFRIITACCIGIILMWFIKANAARICAVAIIAFVPIEAVTLTVIAIFRRVKGARILGTGVLLFCMFILSLFVMQIVKGNDNVNGNTVAGFIYLIFMGMAILSLPVSMSLYLAWKFATVNKDLKNQLNQVQILSDKSLEQERETKQILETQNEVLEKEVAIRTAEIVAQKQLIELKNKAITDNIDYAQRIQSAILPDTKLIYKTLTQSFILFLPKDIVSGDFYAFAERNGRIFIIAGDCTGHGVSGAFMSMIGSSLLNQIINEKGIEQPARILTELNKAVIEALKQSENESNDGMDIAICSFDQSMNELQYAGANRPLWLVRNNEIITYSPDKFPIGGLQMARDRAFTNHSIQLQPSDTIYIFTDGYSDQFGGPHGKKLMKAKFRETLLSIQPMDMLEQETHLRQFFEQWKGDTEQVDDVLVIGVRI